MKKIKIQTTALLKPFKYHNQIRENLLLKINNAYSDKLNVKDDYIYDEIDRLDFSKSSDYYSREWVQLVKPKLEEHFNECAKDLNYQICTLHNIWYQQYSINNTHGWHTHGENYTGVYYLQFPKGSPKTELIDQYNIRKKITINAKEGDIVIFPSFIVHRAPKVLLNIKKTIISFNLQFDFINPDVLPTINSL